MIWSPDSVYTVYIHENSNAESRLRPSSYHHLLSSSKRLLLHVYSSSMWISVIVFQPWTCNLPSGSAALKQRRTSPRTVVVQSNTTVFLPCPVRSFHATYRWEVDNFLKSFPCLFSGDSCVLGPAVIGLPLREGVFRCMATEDGFKVEVISYRLVYNAGPRPSALGSALLLAAAALWLLWLWAPPADADPFFFSVVTAVSVVTAEERKGGGATIRGPGQVRRAWSLRRSPWGTFFSRIDFTFFFFSFFLSFFSKKNLV